MAIQFLTTKEAADVLNITVQGVIKAIKREQLIAYKVGGEKNRRGMWIIPRSEVERYKEERRPQGWPPKTKNSLPE